jgi:predicted nucleic acid-binding protein
MSGVVVDSNILLDLFTEDQQRFEWSSEALAQAAETSRLVVNLVIYAEISTHFSRVEDLDAALPREMFVREPIPFEAAFLAGRVFVLYRRRGGQKRSPLPDFFIGAHASVANYRLLTRDAATYRTYFPKLSLITP